jgi:hypothetical protein
VPAGEVASYFTEEFWAYHEMFAMTEILEIPPYGGGWTSWPAENAQALALFKAERNRIDAEEARRDD